jgi:hypothetical protein
MNTGSFIANDLVYSDGVTGGSLANPRTDRLLASSDLPTQSYPTSFRRTYDDIVDHESEV